MVSDVNGLVRDSLESFSVTSRLWLAEGTSEYLLDRLAFDPDAQVRLSVAGNRNTSVGVLVGLAERELGEVFVDCFIGNPSVPNWLRLKLMVTRLAPLYAGVSTDMPYEWVESLFMEEFKATRIED